MTRPTLVVISGPSGHGKTTLAHELARAIRCPAICRDEIKEGMVHAVGEFAPEVGDELTRRTFPLFFEVLRMLLSAGVTTVAEAAFQHHNWAANLEPLEELARLRIVQCKTDSATALRRVTDRAPLRNAHTDALLIRSRAEEGAYFDQFRRLSIGAPSIEVDTTTGYVPPLERIVAFVNDPG